ncbi:beta-lactamase/transpeptidase-like protein [Dacryopinax primogenitus]|uniref:Beta-lactamase/transpeptidase-like protein n=1 Tax=Dacryopinax primogenitus (strain DJM 731) TaxID=1858805 RepID=M5FXV5_DACPD|nr:beta-lactamase/transpeptidase-like protein [Dacryopinax primogenitus]EJU02876.1 beta-lactamase/transpeptidase-like protein [Dacryopinax primogenitus]
MSSKPVINDGLSEYITTTLFGIASCSKAFSAFASCILMSDYSSSPPPSYAPLPQSVETFDWHTPVKSLYPEFELQDKFAETEMQMWDLVAHTCGLPTHDLAYGYEERDKVLERLKWMKPNRGLSEEWQYNNMMFMVNARIIENLSGMRYTDFVTERILKPLKMDHSTYWPSEAAKLGAFSQAFCWVPGVDGETNWIKCLLSGGMNPHTGERLCSAGFFKHLTTARVVGGFSLANNPRWPETSATLYSAGLFTHHYQGHQVFSHTGGTPRVSSYQVFCPNDNLGIVLLSNLGSRQNVLLAAVHRIMEDVLSLPHIDWPSRLRSDVQHPSFAAKQRATTHKRAEGVQLPLPLESYTGKYTSPSYGNLTFYSTESRPSEERDAILSAFSAVDNSPSAPPLLAPDVPQLYARFPRIWGSHLRLQHSEGPLWQARLEALYPHGFGKDRSPFVRAADVLEAEFEVEGGKVRRMWIIRYSLAQPVRKGDYEKAKQWFEKVD